jgi:hypothetical protein
MRGAGRVGGRSFKPPVLQRANEPFDPFELGLSPFVGDLPVAPQLQPLNDEWSVSDFDDPTDPRDCSKYPASPYCEGDTIRLGKPLGYDAEIRSNGCTTCVYIYPVVAWLKLTPTIICRRDPNCDKEPQTPNLAPFTSLKPPRLNENVQPDRYKSPECAARESAINAQVNIFNDRAARDEENFYYNISRSNPENIRDVQDFSITRIQANGDAEISFGKQGLTYQGVVFEKGGLKVDLESGQIVFDPELEVDISVGVPASIGFTFKRWIPAPCPQMPIRPTIQPPPPLPPPFGRGGGDRKKRGNNKMCCNDCRDSKDNTDALLKELREIRKVLGTGKLETALNAAVGIGDGSITALINRIARRLGTESYPIEVPESLIQGFGDKILKIQNNAEYLAWLTYQIDGLVGQFPIEIQVKDIDPLTAGDQTKKIQLPNIAEAIAEMYGLSLKSTVNQEIELNMLLRLAAEVIATKNGMVVTQDYARANANFLGYKANYKARELDYNFDFAGANLDPKAKEPIVLEKLLKTVKGFVQGWELEDKETVVGFLQKLMFSAGIIKAVFFRGKGQQKELQRELTSMGSEEKTQEAKFEAFLKEINDPNSRFNKLSEEKPQIKDETPPDSKGGKK